MASKKSVNEWEGIFKQYDKDNSGTLDVKELKDMLKSNLSNMTDSQIADAFVFFDGPDGDRKITLAEFTNGMNKMVEMVTSLTSFFQECDTDNSGTLERDELKSVILKAYPSMPAEEVEQIFKEADQDGNGKISLEEFLRACT